MKNDKVVKCLLLKRILFAYFKKKGRPERIPISGLPGDLNYFNEVKGFNE